MTMQDYTNIAAGTMLTGWQNAMTNAAQQAAQAAYNQAVLAGQSDDRALAWAKFAWQQKMDEAGQTGMWNGQYNMPTEQWFTGQFGQWYGPGGSPQAGDQTLQANQQAYNQAYQNSQLYGQYYAPGTTPGVGTATQSAQQQASQRAQQNAALTGYLQNTGSGNIVADAWATLDPATQQAYLQSSPGGNDAQEAMNRYYQNYQQAVYARAREAGVAITPQLMSDVVYGGWNQQGTETMQHQQQMFSQQLQQEQEARAAQAQQQSQAMSYLNLLSNLRGPADWAKYQQVLGSTPGGMRDLVAAAMGQYVPGGGATTGVAPQAASLQSMMAQVGGYDYGGQGGGQLNMPNVYTGGQGSYGGQPGTMNTYSSWQGPNGEVNNQQAGTARGAYFSQQWPGVTQQPAGGGQVWGSGIGVGQQQPTPQQQQQGLGGGTNLPAPNQIAAQSWNNMAPTQKQMLLGMYESQGWDKTDVEALMNQSMPKYATNAASAGTWRLQ